VHPTVERYLRTLQRLRGDLLAWLGKLSQRERIMVTAAAVAVFVFVTSLTSLSISRGITLREQRIEEKTRLLSSVSKLAEGFRQRQAERQALEGRLRAPMIQLLSYISQQGAQFQIEVGELRPTAAVGETEGFKEDAVEVNLARVDIARLAHFLQALERGQGVVRVRRLRLTTRTDDPRLVDATFTVSSYGLKI
jgi:general secretion pathway protein M